jgi:hypothetical protein
VIKLQILGHGVFGELTAKETEVILDGGVGEQGRIKIQGCIRRVEFRKHYLY